MINSLTMTGYRAFKRFEMTELGWVNLLVGKNNTGKTSILEALYLLASGESLNALWQVLARRGEQLLPEQVSPNRIMQAEADLSHLFHGHELANGTRFALSTTNEKPGRSLLYTIAEAKPEESPVLFQHLADDGISGPRLALSITGTTDSSSLPIPLSRSGSLRADVVQQALNLRPLKGDAGVAQFVTSESFSVQQMSQLWNSIVLTSDEDRVIQALQILEPRIERIAQVQVGMMQIPGQGYVIPSRGGYFLRLEGDPRRVPIGSFGDGMWRMFAIVVALVRAKDSVLLIDEIDTGLHYTVMADMWRLVHKAARVNNVQVFATTHSYDCVHSLAAICDSGSDNDATIQRVERGKKRAIPFSKEEIRMAAEQAIEIR